MAAPGLPDSPPGRWPGMPVDGYLPFQLQPSSPMPSTVMSVSPIIAACLPMP
jgi:hypothetical protein